MNYIKNLKHDQTINLLDEIDVKPGQVISKTLAQNNFVSLTIFGFSKGEEISTHASSGDAMVTILDGFARITIDGQENYLEKGQTIVMSANKPHALFALEDFKMLLTVVFPLSE